MRMWLAGGMLTLAVLFPSLGNAQVYSLPSLTRPPDVTAASAEWQINNRPILVQGLVFFPTSETRMFDSNVMIQTGVFEGVPVYSDATIEPFSLVYVPVGRASMRAYERRRDRELAGTTGSRTPTFPVAPAASPVQTPERAAVTVGISAATATMTASLPAPEPSRPARTAVESIPRPRATDGIWIRFNGAKWYTWRHMIGYSFAAVLINNYILMSYLQKFGVVPIPVPDNVWTAMLVILGAAAAGHSWEQVAYMKAK